jgi:outer membrane protein TolC
MYRFLYILSISVVSISSSLDSHGQVEDKNGTHTSYTETAEAFFPALQVVLVGVDAQAPILLEEREKVNEATANRMVADSKRGLRLSVALNGHSLHEDRPNTDYYQQYRFLASAYVHKPLYHWGALRAESRIAELAEKSSSESYGELFNTLSDRIRSDYLSLILSTYGMELAQRSLELAKSNAEGMAERLRLGLVTELSLSEAKTAVLQQRINLAELERKLNQSKLIFRDDTGFDGNLSLSMTNRFIEFSENHVFAQNLPLATGIISSIGLETIGRAIEMENNRIVIAESGLRPKFNVVGGFYQDRVDLHDSTSSIERNNVIVGVEANWSVFDSSSSRGQKRSALARKRRYEMQLDRETRRLRMEVKNLRDHLITLGRIIESSRQLVDAAEDRFEKSQIEFDRNRITPEVFFTYRLALDQSRLSLLASVANYLNVRSQYVHLLGANSK